MCFYNALFASNNSMKENKIRMAKQTLSASLWAT